MIQFLGSFITRTSVTITNQNVPITSDFATTSTSLVDVTGLTVTLADRSGGKFLAVCQLPSLNSDAGAAVRSSFILDGTELEGIRQDSSSASDFLTGILTESNDLDGTILKVQGRVSAGTGTWAGNVLALRCKISVLEIS